MRHAALLLVPVLAGCLSDNARRPDLGACAGTPEGKAPGYGEIPIGTCLAGPVDLEFVERDGRPWLAVSNADPFINFDGGSLLLLDWEDVLAQLDTEQILIDELAADALPTERFVAGMGFVPGQERGILTRRLTEDGRTRTGEDGAYVVDLAALTLEDAGQLLKDDPADVVIDGDRAFALNLTDHSISLLDVRGTTIVPIDLAPEASIVPLAGIDADASGSVAELGRLSVEVPEDVPDDTWTLEYIPGTVRAYSPNGEGLDLWSSGGGPYQVNALGEYVDVGSAFAIADPVFGFSSLDETSFGGGSIQFASGGAIFNTVQSLQVGAVWDAPQLVLPSVSSGWDMERAGPSRTVAQGVLTLYYDGRVDGGLASIGRATSNDNVIWLADDTPLIVPPAGSSFEQPFAQIDARTGQVRMWLSMWDGFSWSVGHTASVDGVTFAPPERIQANVQLAAPTVRWVDGRYVMWAATPRWDQSAWDHVVLTSPDGIAWSTPEVVFPSDVPFDLQSPPRLAIQAQPGSAWRISGLDNGLLSEPVVPGLQYFDANHGVRFSVASGHEVSNDLFEGARASQGLFPTSHVDIGGLDRLYVTTIADDGVPRIGLLTGFSDDWSVRAWNLIPRGSGGNVGGASHAVVRQVGPDWVMVYAALDGEGVSAMWVATSPDGVAWTARGDGPIAPFLGEWAGAAQEPRTLELLEGGGARIWFAGSNGSRSRIGAIETAAFDPAAPQDAVWTLFAGNGADWQLAPGLPGSVDDSGVKDPVVVGSGDDLQMIYSAFDGVFWHLAHARYVDGVWVRRTDPITDGTMPAMSPVPRSFSAGGVDHPVAHLRQDGDYEVWYAGVDLPTDDGIRRLGRARSRLPFVFPEQRLPSLGDTLGYQTTRGDEVVSVIELGQDVDAFRTTGIGTTSLIQDTDRGFLYVPSKLSNLLYVVDVRDDSRVGFVDENALDLEGLVRLPAVAGVTGFRGGVLHPTRDRLYLTTTNPDGVLVVDTTAIPDDERKEILDAPTLALLPLQDADQDEGSNTVSRIGGAHPALFGDLLLVPHFRDNSVSVIDLSLGAHGLEIAHIPFVGENPHRIVISPDQRFAVVANYLGDVSDEDLSSSTLALIDLDPASPTWLQVVHRIVNR